MNIVLIAHNLRASGGLSVGKGIVSTLPNLAPQHEFLVIVPAGCGYPDHSDKTNVEVLECPQMSLLKRYFWERRTMRPAINDFKSDWIWCLGNIGLSNPGTRQSVLFHQAHSIYPSCHHGYTLLTSIVKNITRLPAQRWLIGRGFRESNRVYCQTQTVRRRLIDSCRLPPDKVGICASSVNFAHPDQPQTKPSRLDEIRGKHSTVLFMPGKFMAHKNYARVIEAFRSIPKSIACVLTISSTDGKQARKLIDIITREQLPLYCIGMIHFSDMFGWYTHADGLLFPSLLETLGLPQLEAMHCGCPVIASDMDFAHEVCRNAALYVNPFSAESIREGILRFSCDHALRKRLSELGQERARITQIDWKDSLRNVLDQEGIEHD
jgi:glycosyltransferase involved in cell wall biosynthesis